MKQEGKSDPDNSEAENERGSKYDVIILPLFYFVSLQVYCIFIFLALMFVFVFVFVVAFGAMYATLSDSVLC